MCDHIGAHYSKHGDQNTLPLLPCAKHAIPLKKVNTAKVTSNCSISGVHAAAQYIFQIPVNNCHSAILQCAVIHNCHKVSSLYAHSQNMEISVL
jgi:hypothetical protein